MSFVYAVRSNFTRPELEEKWHAWYSGPKLAEMVIHPHFLSGQRYEAVGFDTTIRYLALWVVDSPDAFTSAEYKASWAGRSGSRISATGAAISTTRTGAT